MKMAWDKDEIQEQEEHSEESAKPKQSEEKKEEPTATVYESGDKVPEIVKEIKAMGQKAFELMEAEDEKQIVNLELLRETVKTFVYKTRQNALIFEVARRYKNIEVGIKNWQKTEDSWIVSAYAKNLRDNLYNEAIVEQKFRTPIGQGGSLVLDSFSFQKAQSKAKRNAIRQVIPANYFQSMIKLFLKNYGGKK